MELRFGVCRLCDAFDVIKGIGEFKFHTVCNLAASEDLVKGLQAYCPEGPRDPKLGDDIPGASLAFEKELYWVFTWPVGCTQTTYCAILCN
jgi:hypothetical protein